MGGCRVWTDKVMSRHPRFTHCLKWMSSDNPTLYFCLCVCVGMVGARQKPHCYIHTTPRKGEDSGEGNRQVSGIFNRGIQSALHVNAELMTQGGSKSVEWIIIESVRTTDVLIIIPPKVPTIGYGDDATKI